MKKSKISIFGHFSHFLFLTVLFGKNVSEVKVVFDEDVKVVIGAFLAHFRRIFPSPQATRDRQPSTGVSGKKHRRPIHGKKGGNIKKSYWCWIFFSICACSPSVCVCAFSKACFLIYCTDHCLQDYHIKIRTKIRTK